MRTKTYHGWLYKVIYTYGYMMLYVYGYNIYIYILIYVYIYIVIYAYTIGKDSSFPNANANESMFFAVSSHRGTTKARPLLRDLLKIPLG